MRGKYKLNKNTKKIYYEFWNVMDPEDKEEEEEEEEIDERWEEIRKGNTVFFCLEYIQCSLD